MNKITLDELFNRYEENIDMLYDAEHDEIFKWRALKTFQKEWFSLEYTDFLSRFNAATKDFSVPQTAERWGISSRRIQILCNEERIPGAVKIGNRWAVSQTLPLWQGQCGQPAQPAFSLPLSAPAAACYPP